MNEIMRLVHGRIRMVQLIEDLVSGLRPGEGFRRLVVLGEVAVDRGLQVDDRAEHAAFEAPAGQGREEEPLDGIQPGAGGRREVEGPARVTGQPGTHLGCLWAP